MTNEPINIDKKSEYQDSKTGKFKVGNPGGGKPKGSFSPVALIRRKLDETIPNSDITYAEALALKLLQMAIRGDLGAIKCVLGYTDGLPVSKQLLSSNLAELIKPILGGEDVRDDDSNSEDTEAQEEN